PLLGPGYRRLLLRRLEVLADQPEDDAVDPLVVAPVRLAADALLDEAGPLGMALGALVEAVDLELEPVEAELEDQVPLEELRRPVGQPPAAKVGMHRERAQVGDPAAPVCDLEAHQARRLAVDLDHEAAELVGLAAGALDLGLQTFAVARPDDGQVRLDIVMRHQLEQEVDVARLGPAKRDLAHGDGAATGSRRVKPTAPDPSATPPRISTMPASSSQVSGSPSSRTP